MLVEHQLVVLPSNGCIVFLIDSRASCLWQRFSVVNHTGRRMQWTKCV